MRPTSTLTPWQAHQLVDLYQHGRGGAGVLVYATTYERLEHLELLRADPAELTERGKRLARYLLGARGVYV